MSSTEPRGWVRRELLPRIRAFLLLGFWFTSIALIAPFLIGLLLITHRENVIYSPVRLFVRIGLAMVGVRVEVTGLERLEPEQAYIFAPNHQSSGGMSERVRGQFVMYQF